MGSVCPVCGQVGCTPAPEPVHHRDHYLITGQVGAKPVPKGKGAAPPKGKRRGKPKHAPATVETSTPETETR